LGPARSTVKGKIHPGYTYTLGEWTGGRIACRTRFQIDLIVGASYDDVIIERVDADSRLILLVLGKGRRGTANCYKCISALGKGWGRQKKADQQHYKNPVPLFHLNFLLASQ
jgi:hypothetical protein